MAAALAEALRGLDVEPEPPTRPVPSSPAAGSPAPREAGLPAPRPPDLTETPPPGFAAPLPPARLPSPAWAEPPPADAATAAEPAVPVRRDPPVQWWRHVDRAAGAGAAGALLLGLLSLFPPTSAQSASRFPGEIATGRFAAGQLPTLLLLLTAIGLHLTRDGHRYRPLLYAVAAGAGCYALVDSLRVYAFTQANQGGAYDSALSRTNGSLPRAAVALAVVVVAMAGVLKTAPRPKPRPGPHLLAASLLAAVAVILSAVAIVVGPAIQVSRVHQMIYGVPLPSSIVAAALLAAGGVSRRLPVVVTSVTLSACAFIAGAVAPDPPALPAGDGGRLLPRRRRGRAAPGQPAPCRRRAAPGPTRAAFAPGVAPVRMAAALGGQLTAAPGRDLPARRRAARAGYGRRPLKAISWVCGSASAGTATRGPN